MKPHEQPFRLRDPSLQGQALVVRPGWNFRRGMFLLDGMIGMMILIAITAGVVGIANGQRRAAIQAADMRAAVRDAETALTNLQSGHPASSGVVLRQIDAAAPAGWVWMEATGTGGSRRATLDGLVPILAPIHGGNR